jgi:hypothetical protein
MSKTGQAAALSKISLTLSITSVEAKPENAATATALPNTSCAHVIAANGAIDNTCDIGVIRDFLEGEALSGAEQGSPIV